MCPRACRCWKPHFRANHVLIRFIFIVLAPPTLPALLRVGTSRHFRSQACMVRDSRREATSESSSFCPRRMWEDWTALTHSLKGLKPLLVRWRGREGGRKEGGKPVNVTLLCARCRRAVLGSRFRSASALRRTVVSSLCCLKSSGGSRAVFQKEKKKRGIITSGG